MVWGYACIQKYPNFWGWQDQKKWSKEHLHINKWAGFLFQNKFFLTNSILWVHQFVSLQRINRAGLKDNICNYHKRSIQLFPKDKYLFLLLQGALEKGAETHELAQHSLLTQAQSCGNKAIWSAGQSCSSSRQLQV